jgi:hypothetical protein
VLLLPAVTSWKAWWYCELRAIWYATGLRAR